MKKTVIVGMSGGVDSSVAALLLKEKGYEVIGVTYDFWHNDDSPDDIYRNLSDAYEARAVADTIGIRHLAVNYTKEFRNRVEKYFVREYLSGRTPNPCVMCNPLVKWAAMLETMKEYSADYVATGHYARIDMLSNGRYAVKNSVTARKDQTYVLYKLSQEALSHTLMPIGDYDKSEIRRIAKENKLPVADKPDSQEVCYIDDNDYAGYIDRMIDGEFSELLNKEGLMRPHSGKFVNEKGEILGEHKGITHYTVGQRRGLSIPAGHRIFVKELRPEKNEVVLSENEELFTRRVIAKDAAYMAVSALDKETECIAKIRYNHAGSKGLLRPINGGLIEVIFDEPVRAATPGQSLVCYKDDYVLCGGVIV
ncbi:MAG: tRNA 2-thiouridine(34) synthase MnmA [Lachnospiraceae bacterium]|nr:tRNA 2-thiouridine(34) synthase MnmA [Lachnospiraceae bacterium]